MTNAELHGCPYPGWVCFHCGEEFRTVGGAADHFGATPDQEPACQIEAGEGRGLVMELRRVEAERDALAAHVERLQADIKSAMIGLDFAQRHSQGHAGTSMQAVAVEQKRLTEALEKAPATALARLIAEHVDAAIGHAESLIEAGATAEEAFAAARRQAEEGS